MNFKTSEKLYGKNLGIAGWRLFIKRDRDDESKKRATTRSDIISMEETGVQPEQPNIVKWSSENKGRKTGL